MAKNRLQKFYNPKLYKPPPKRELSEEERITLNMGGTLAPTQAPASLVQASAGGIDLDSDIQALREASFMQIRAKARDEQEAPPAPPPETPSGDYEKSEESGGVLAMMDMLKADVEKEIQEMTINEKND